MVGESFAQLQHDQLVHGCNSWLVIMAMLWTPDTTTQTQGQRLQTNKDTLVSQYTHPTLY